MPFILTPNMNLPESIVGQSSGLEWETNLNTSLTLIDQHDHSPGKGVQITPNGLNINGDLPVNGNNVTMIRASKFASQAMALPGSEIDSLYVSGVDLWYNDGSGYQIQITSGGAVNATASGIVSGTASASFVSSVLVVNENTNTPADIKAGSIHIGNNTVGSNYVTVVPHSSLASSYQLTLPLLPASTSFLTVDTSGNITATPATSQGITRSFLAPVGQVFASSGNFTTTSTSQVGVVSQTITTTGRPVQVMFMPDGSGNVSYVGMVGLGNSGNNEITFYLYRGVTLIAQSTISLFSSAFSGVSDISQLIPPGALNFLDTPSAGTYIYELKAAVGASSTTGVVHYVNLGLYEL